MFEVIWSNFSDKYIVRPLGTLSSVKPQMIGTKAECDKWCEEHNNKNRSY